MPRVHVCLAAALLLCSSAAAHAARVERVDIIGLDEEMTENVRVSLGLQDAVGRDISGRRMGYLLREAERETRKALEPFGYYSPTIDVQRDREGDVLSVRVVVDPGQPVRVRNSDIAIIGEGGQDRYLARDIARFVPSEGAVFSHPEYDASRNQLSRRLTERGYFDAEFASRRVEVTRADFAADIDVVWNSGDRYNMGATTFEQTPEQIINDDLLENLVYWEEGSYYHQGRIDRLRSSLGRLDYFSNIDIEPQVDQANERREVPVKVTLTPAKRSIYTSGVSYGTDSGAGIRLGVERRYVNMRGHKALAQLDYAQRRKTLTLQYRVPAFAWLDGWYTASLQMADEQTDYIDSRRVELVGSRNGQYNEFLNLIASIHVLRERWAYAPEEDPDNPVVDDDEFAGALYRYATFAYPSLRAEYIDVDDRLFPTSGIGGSVMLRGGLEGVGSDASFGQIHLRASWFKGIGERNRLIVRGELGHTFTDVLVGIPPSLRFYAGGDRSIRGYDWREVGPRIPARDGRRAFAIGAKNVVTASVEFERYFTDTIGAAVFVDSGDAFDGTSPEWRTGVGIGARYKSPVGPLKLDIARGLDNPDSSFTIGLSIGAEF
ncbi:autotransporter assembly complex protein TamA [Luteimonas fraxinea]|uniref:Translocation and assembly module subunit TamA n=1 Tax=Luteimonas fraxinea TaxID=2901869 RepID=A0ABS8UE15_9GAMM|nr:autotransporter assembly complex family protein [Luteimonas fraxinea]MCD9097733.1 autotransporter assembly complex protein TamA [Luteimonas fraxinea]MCD9127555.1 autotransporter assembly complex protein TamA [Luteimonas fraxinea]